jgi:phosphatidylinositol alpha-1,6-mannosyltransferase
VNHLLVTNDFPPKVGGIQSYLWELWRRLPPERTTVLTAARVDASAFDAAQPFRLERARRPVLLPTPALARHIDRLADEVDAGIVLLDPALPLGWLGPRLARPYGVVLHGAEVTVPGRLPGVRVLLGHVLRGAQLVVAAGGYPATEGARAAGRSLPTVVVPPGVDVERFAPLAPGERRAARARLGLDPDRPLVVSVSRLVPRKGMDVLIDAVCRVRRSQPDVELAIVGAGRDRRRLERRAAGQGVPVRFLGRVPEADLPVVHACADVFAMLCRNRWLGLEQEGFGIVFLEASACAVPVIAGRSGGSHEAVVDGATGVVVDDARSAGEVAERLGRLLADPAGRARMGEAGRRRVAAELTYDTLAGQLGRAIDEVGRPA